jgi:fatty acid desaturase
MMLRAELSVTRKGKSSEAASAMSTILSSGYLLLLLLLLLLLQFFFFFSLLLLLKLPCFCILFVGVCFFFSSHARFAIGL